MDQTEEPYSCMDENCFVNSEHYFPEKGSGIQGIGTTNLIRLVIVNIIFLFGLIGNCLVIFVIVRFRKMRSSVNIYLANLAVADSLFLFYSATFWTLRLINVRPQFLRDLEKFVLRTHNIVIMAGSGFLVIVTVDRFLAVCHFNTFAKLRTKKGAWITSLFVWVISICVTLPCLGGQWGRRVCPWYTATTEFLVPFLILLVLNVLIIRRLKTSEAVDSEKSVTKMLLAVTVAYFLLWFPLRLLTLDEYNLPVHWNNNLHLVASGLTCINSGLNPYFYAFYSKKFREAFWKACCCVRVQHGRSSNENPEPTTVVVTTAI